MTDPLQLSEFESDKPVLTPQKVWGHPPVWGWLMAVIGTLGFGGIFIFLGVLILMPPDKPTPGSRAEAQPGVTLPVLPVETPTPSEANISPVQPTPTATAEPTRLPTPTATHLPTLAPTIVPLVDSRTIGYSVRDRPLEATIIGNGTQTLVVMGAIHGDEGNTAELITFLIDYFTKNVRLVTAAGGRLYLIPAINPDGLSTKSRLNANGVNLDANWNTSNWRTDSLGAGGRSLRGGGPAPFSEPETRAVSSLLLELSRTSLRPVRVVFYHAIYPPSGMAQPSYTLEGGTIAPDPDTARLAETFAQIVGARYITRFDYPITGEAIHWCGENHIQCIDVELPKRENVSAPVFEQHVLAILAMLR